MIGKIYKASNITKEFQLEDDKYVVENSYYSLKDAIKHAMRLKKWSHKNRPLKIYDVTNGKYELVKQL